MSVPFSWGPSFVLIFSSICYVALLSLCGLIIINVVSLLLWWYYYYGGIIIIRYYSNIWYLVNHRCIYGLRWAHMQLILPRNRLQSKLDCWCAPCRPATLSFLLWSQNRGHRLVQMKMLLARFLILFTSCMHSLFILTKGRTEESSVPVRWENEVPLGYKAQLCRKWALHKYKHMFIR